MDASEAARSLKGVDAAVISRNYAADANPTVKTTLFVDATDKANWRNTKNIIAVKESEKTAKTLQESRKEIFQSDRNR